VYSPQRYFRIFRITHIKSGFFYLTITVSREYSLMAFVERLNDMTKWGPDKKYQNAPLLWFVRKFGPFLNTEFTVTLEEGEHRHRHNAIEVARALAVTLGTDKLLCSTVISKRDWALYERAVIELSPEGKLKAGKASTPTILESRGHLTIDSRPMDKNLRVEQILMFLRSNYIAPVVLTKLLDEQFKRCQDSKHVASVVLDIELPVNGRFGTSLTSFALIHIAPTIADAMREMELLASAFITNHTPDSEYK
jgi:hypothetical protein